jgi:hypothetical protein
MQLQAQTRPVEESKFEKGSSSGCESWRFCLIAKQVGSRMRWNAGHQLSAAVSMRRLTDMNEFTHDFRRFAAGTFVRD